MTETLERAEESDDNKLQEEPEAKDARELALSIVDETTMTVDAVLTYISEDFAEWEFNSKRIEVGTRNEQYQAFFKNEFKNWLKQSFKTLTGMGRNPSNLSIPGKLTLSDYLIFGWVENEDHPDAVLLSIGEIMDS